MKNNSLLITLSVLMLLVSQGFAFTTSKALRESIKKNPTNLRAHLQIGSLHFKARSYRKALKHWVYVARRRPKAVNLKYYIGVAYYRLRQERYLKKAKMVWEHVLKHQPKHGKANRALERVKKELATVAPISPAKPKVDAAQQRAKAMQSRLDGDPFKGTQLLQPLVDDGETSPAIIKELALCYLEDTEKPELAIKYFQLTLKKSPKDEEALLGLAQSYGLLGDFKKQIQLFEECLFYSTDNAEIHFQLGLAYDQEENPPKLIEHFQRAIQLDASYKKRLQPLIKTLKTAEAIGHHIEMIIKKTEHSMLSEEEIDTLARQLAKQFGLDEPTPEQLETFKDKANDFRRKRKY